MVASMMRSNDCRLRPCLGARAWAVALSMDVVVVVSDGKGGF
jgi:hypothetical protein